MIFDITCASRIHNIYVLRYCSDIGSGSQSRQALEWHVCTFLHQQDEVNLDFSFKLSISLFIYVINIVVYIICNQSLLLLDEK